MKQDEEIWFPGRNVNMYDVVVIGAGGALVGYGGGLDMKTALLALEKAHRR